MRKDEKIAEQFIVASGWQKQTGFAINTKEMNPEDWEEVFFEGKTLEKAITDYFRKATWWSYIPANGEMIEEDIWDAVEHVEENGESTFEDFKKYMKKN